MLIDPETGILQPAQPCNEKMQIQRELVNPETGLIELLTMTEDDNDNDPLKTVDKSRKRLQKPKMWKRHQRKTIKNTGEEYSTKKGLKKRKRLLQQSDCERKKCKRRCHEHISEAEREGIHYHYWKVLDTYDKKQTFICEHVSTESTRHKTVGECSRRSQTLAYFLTVGGEKKRVCRDFFLRTLDETPDKVRYNLKKRHNRGGVNGDQRGKARHEHPSISDTDKQVIKNHIMSYPAVESHYCRSSSKRKYLPQNLSIAEMFRQYKVKCIADNITPLKEHAYREIFCTEFNLGFHQPKKDQCSICNKYKGNESDSTFVSHQMRKEEARAMKESDKQHSIQNHEHYVASFDLQKVLTCPAGKVGTIYYKRKLATYNLTIFDMRTKQGYCYIWDETTGKRGSCEIASCLWLWLQTLPTTVNKVTLYSDSCSGQNRNTSMIGMMLAAVELLSIQEINHKFLEPGHTQMEVDSMHSCIERASKAANIYVPHDWSTVASLAKKTGKPYHVVKMQQTNFLDFKNLSEQIVNNKSKLVSGKKFSFMQCKWMRFEKSSNTVKVKTTLDDSEFDLLRVHNSATLDSASLRHSMVQLYKHQISISIAKHNDLLYLCDKLVIPKEFHDFYRRLNSSDCRDNLDEPDIEESDVDEDCQQHLCALPTAVQGTSLQTRKKRRRNKLDNKITAASHQAPYDKGKNHHGTMFFFH
jgi:hypothetical protein